MSRSHRDEFKRKVRAAVFARAWRADRDCYACEACQAALKVGEGEIDHILPVALGGLPEASNARLLCKPCHKGKTASDIARVRKSDRQRDRFTGAVRPAGTIAARPAPLTAAKAKRQARLRDRAALAVFAPHLNGELGSRA